jgi:cell division protein FtsQ
MRRRSPSAAARLRPFWIVGILAACAALAGAYYLATWPALRPQKIVVTGNRVVRRAEIVGAARVSRTQNLWLQNTGAMVARIERIPDVDVAIVRRIPPATLSIAVTERLPYAIVGNGSEHVVVDRTLRVLQPGAEGERSLPVLVAPGAVLPSPGHAIDDAALRALRDDGEALAAAGIDPALLRHDRFGGLTVTLRGGIRVLFGDENDLTEKARLVNPILHQLAAKASRITAIDLRAPSTPVVDYRR